MPKEKLAAAFHCHGPAIENATRVPIMLVTGTGATGEQAYAIGEDDVATYTCTGCGAQFESWVHP